MRIVALSFVALLAHSVGCSQDEAQPDYPVVPGGGGPVAASSTSGGTGGTGGTGGGTGGGNTGADAGTLLDGGVPDGGVTLGNDGGIPSTGTGGVTTGGGQTTSGGTNIDGGVDNTQDQTPPLPDQIP